jgi:hypothetical protein
MSKSVSLAMAMMLPLSAGAETLADLRTKMSGAEVEITGHIGTGLDMMDKEALHFRDAEGTTYQVVFDAGRDARKKLAGCEFAMFGGGKPCAFSGKAELEWNGSQLRLIVFEVSQISPPAPLN